MSSNVVFPDCNHRIFPGRSLTLNCRQTQPQVSAMLLPVQQFEREAKFSPSTSLLAIETIKPSQSQMTKPLA